MDESKKQAQATPGKPKFETPEDGADLFVTAEDGYVNQGMRVCMEAFLQRLEARVEIGHPILSEDDIHQVFGSYRLVYEFNKRMLKALKELRMVSKDHLLQNLGTTVWQFVPFFKVYQDYNSKFNQIAAAYDNLNNSSTSFSRFCAVGKHVHGKSLDFYLKLPVKRLPRYLRSLAEIYEAIPDKYTSYANDIARAAFGIKKVTDDITSAIKVSDMQRLVFELNAKIFGGRLNGILIPKRYVIFNGKLKYVPKDAKFKNIKEHSVIVFNDLLLWGTAKTMFSGGNVEGVLPCHGVVAARLESSKEYVAKHQFKVTAASGDFAVFAAGSEAEIDKWLKYIAEAKDSEDHTLQPTNPKGLLERVQGKGAAGQPETIMVTDEKRKAEIKAWEESKKDPAEFKPLLRPGDEYTPPSPLNRSMSTIGAARPAAASSPAGGAQVPPPVPSSVSAPAAAGAPPPVPAAAAAAAAPGGPGLPPPPPGVAAGPPSGPPVAGLTAGAPPPPPTPDAKSPPPVPGSPRSPRPQTLQAPMSPRRGGRGAAPPPPRSPNQRGRAPPPPRRGATSAPPPPSRGAAGAPPPLALQGGAAPPPVPAAAGAPPPPAAAGAPPPAPAIGGAAPPPVPAALANGPPVPPPAPVVANGAPPIPKPGGASGGGGSGRDALLAAIRGGKNLKKGGASTPPPAAKATPRGSGSGGGGGRDQVLGDIRRGITLRKTATTKPPVAQLPPPSAAKSGGGNDLMSLLNNSLQNYRRFVEDDDDDDDDEDWA